MESIVTEAVGAGWLLLLAAVARWDKLAEIDDWKIATWWCQWDGGLLWSAAAIGKLSATLPLDTLYSETVIRARQPTTSLKTTTLTTSGVSFSTCFSNHGAHIVTSAITKEKPSEKITLINIQYISCYWRFCFLSGLRISLHYSNLWQSVKERPCHLQLQQNSQNRHRSIHNTPPLLNVTATTT